MRSNGTVAVWGDNTTGQLNIPAGLSNVAAISGGFLHSLALQSNGTVVAWGDNSQGQRNIPSDLSDVTTVLAGAYANMALKRNETVVVWGSNLYGQQNVPQGLSNVVAIAGYNHFLALKRDGTVVAWGAGMTNTGSGQDWGQVIVPPGLSDVVSVASNGRHSLALLARAAPPAITAQFQGTNMVLSWPESPAGWRLLSATTLTSPADWQPWASLLLTNQGTVSALVSPSNSSRFFRLRSP